MSQAHPIAFFLQPIEYYQGVIRRELPITIFLEISKKKAKTKYNVNFVGTAISTLP